MYAYIHMFVYAYIHTYIPYRTVPYHTLHYTTLHSWRIPAPRDSSDALTPMLKRLAQTGGWRRSLFLSRTRSALTANSRLLAHRPILNNVQDWAYV